MLKFEFVQDGEFDDPYYRVRNRHGVTAGEIYWHIKSRIWAVRFDYEGGLQYQTLDEISQKIKELNNRNYPVVLMGDFNVEPNSVLIKNISEDMINSNTVAKVKFGPTGTFNGFKFNEAVTRKIDYIFISKSKQLTVNKYAVLSDSNNLKYPSDHFPVYVELAME